ncbi:hypothetical protein NA57DRAFT_71197 [Rhizodiscina lignyota]|uniref:RRM domain-containing protein n=1 Tax=Rhizodiscina lignyota TaxID=1504668 RepID=A0A9P4IV61_9PEZI|nr:hypothetical protein NA57DRAFT_71197 [Rhizodiscina lignyota]
MADDDNFDIDIYGDDNVQDYPEPVEADASAGAAMTEVKNEPDTRSTTLDNSYEEANNSATPANDTSQNYDSGQTVDNQALQSNNASTQAISSTTGDTSHSGPPKRAPVQQGVKRKEGETDGRDIAPGATNALLISELHWYQDEDDVRGWANQAGVEDEVKELTFNEHKVNGKSKGQVFVLLAGPQASTALKHKLDSYSNPSGTGTPAPAGRKHVATFHPAHNPYKTLPKENPNRRDQSSSTGRGNFSQGTGFRGGNRGGSFNRGGGGGMQNNFNQGRNFSSPGMGGQGGGFGGPGGNMGGGGFNSGMGMGGFNNNFRGGMGMGGMNRGGGGMMRGGRGGMGGMNNMGMGMGTMGGMNNMGMGMGGMGMGGPMGGMMGGGFGGPQQQQPHFNPAFFNGQGGMGAGDWGNHPNKRQRQE